MAPFICASQFERPLVQLVANAATSAVVVHTDIPVWKLNQMANFALELDEENYHSPDSTLRKIDLKAFNHEVIATLLGIGVSTSGALQRCMGNDLTDSQVRMSRDIDEIPFRILLQGQGVPTHLDSVCPGGVHPDSVYLRYGLVLREPGAGGALEVSRAGIGIDRLVDPVEVQANRGSLFLINAKVAHGIRSVLDGALVMLRGGIALEPDGQLVLLHRPA